MLGSVRPARTVIQVAQNSVQPDRPAGGPRHTPGTLERATAVRDNRPAWQILQEEEAATLISELPGTVEQALDSLFVFFAEFDAEQEDEG